MQTPALNEVVTGSELILDGLNVKNTLLHTAGDGSWSEVISEALVFPEGSKAYQLTFESSSTNYEINLGDWCEGSDNDRWEALNNTCNAYFLNDDWATTLESLEVESSAETTPTTFISAIIGLSNANVVSHIISDGTVDFYQVSFDGATSSQLSSGSWIDITVHGETLREITVPQSIANLDYTWSNLTEESNQYYLTVYGGFVRVAYVDFDEDDGEYVFNKIAKDFIIENADRDLIDDGMTSSETVTIANASISIDGSVTDWESITPIMTDEIGDAGIGGLDISALYLAQDTDNLYLRLDKASLELPIANAYYNYWIYFESDDGGPEFSVELFHDDNDQVYPRLYDSTGVDRDYNQLDQLLDSLAISTNTQHIEVTIPKSSIDASAEYTVDFFTHYSHEANTWTDLESEHDDADIVSTVMF